MLTMTSDLSQAAHHLIAFDFWGEFGAIYRGMSRCDCAGEDN